MKRLLVLCGASLLAFLAFGSQQALGQTSFCTGFSNTQDCENWCWSNYAGDFGWLWNCLDGCEPCVWECTEDSDCSGEVCLYTECVECYNDSHCGPGEICPFRTCEDAECIDSSDCAPSELCNGGFCENLETPVLISVADSKFELTSWQDGVSFDIDGDGVAERTAWTTGGSDDAFLALDRNGNGQIDDATELFGNHTLQEPSADPNGFWALTRLDALDMGGNGDGMISAQDTVFPELQLWFDINHNGLAEAEELHPLSLYATAIDLDYGMQQRVDQHGNLFRYKAKVHRQDGGVRMAYDVIFAVEQ